VAMQILRHAQISITMEIYTEVPDKATRDALKRLSDLFSGDGKRRKKKPLTWVCCCTSLLCTQPAEGPEEPRIWPLTWARSEGFEPPAF
jgi:hypothetical protein